MNTPTIPAPRAAARHRLTVEHDSPPASRVLERPAATVGTFLAVAAAATTLLVLSGSGLTAYGIAVVTLLAVKLGLSLAPSRRYPAAPPASVRTAVVVPFYNEDPDLLARTLASVDDQTHLPDWVVIVDDGSSSDAAALVAEQWTATRAGTRLIRMPGNVGKREAMAAAFRALDGQVDVWVCVDSDTVLDPHAVREGLRPFHDPKVMAATGTVVASNPRANLLTRLIDVRYANAFLYERAAYSRLGAVLCVCGSLGLYRASLISEVLDEFTGQTFLGQPQVFGDDRHLTNQALTRGRVVLARGAIAHTAVPERIGHLIRQQVRWGKSFFRESLWALTHLRPRMVGWWLTLIEAATWLVFTTALLAAMVVRPIAGHVSPLEYVAWCVLAGYARSVHVFSVRRPDQRRRDQLAAFLLAPVYGVLHMLVLLPLRVWSLATLRQRSWGTRAAVEVHATPALPPIALAKES